MKRLIKGYREFRARRWPAERANYLTLAKQGQKPEYLIIACSDSRSDPATIFSAHPGELFVVRNVAALVPPYEDKTTFSGTRAAIAYAVLVLQVRNILVMGHEQCAGVAAVVDPDSVRGIPFVGEWVALAKPAIHGHSGYQAERATVRLSVDRLKAYPFIAERMKAGSLEVDGAHFSIVDGTLDVLDQNSGAFEPLVRPPFLVRLFTGRRAA